MTENMSTKKNEKLDEISDKFRGIPIIGKGLINV